VRYASGLEQTATSSAAVPSAQLHAVPAAGLLRPGREYSLWVVGGITAVYALTIAFTAAHHEPWRDEVVPMSLAKQVPSVAELWRVLRYEGHPILWYLVLRCAYLAFGTTGVMPVASVLIAVAAVVVFLTRAPLPLWLKTLFVFGYFPLYEYSVIARGNGLAMLLLFTFCALYARRGTHPVALAATLAILANTTVLAFLLAAVAGVMIAIDAAVARQRSAVVRGHYVALAVYLVGMGHALASNIPGTSAFPATLDLHDLAPVATAFVQAVANPVAQSAFMYWIPLPGLWIWLLCLALLRRRPAQAAFLFLGLLGFELVFALVYPASPRHAGYVLLVVIATIWLADPWQQLDSHPGEGLADHAERWIRRLLLVPLTVALCYQVVLGAGYVVDDVQLEYSSSKRLGALIAADPRLDRAIVIGEPETLQQSLPYYRDNPIYLPQENAFRAWMWSPSLSFSLSSGTPTRNIAIGRRADYNLAELLSTAGALRDRHGVPVVMVLGWWVEGPEVQRAYVGTWFEQVFTVSPEARTAFLARTQFLGRLRSAAFTDENYDVFVLW
jgi:hypothetical protein